MDNIGHLHTRRKSESSSYFGSTCLSLLRATELDIPEKMRIVSIPDLNWSAPL